MVCSVSALETEQSSEVFFSHSHTVDWNTYWPNVVQQSNTGQNNLGSGGNMKCTAHTELTVSVEAGLMVLPSTLFLLISISHLRLLSILSRRPLSRSSLTHSCATRPACLRISPSISLTLRMYSLATPTLASAHCSRKQGGGNGTTNVVVVAYGN